MGFFEQIFKRSGQPEVPGEPKKEEEGIETRERTSPIPGPEEEVLMSGRANRTEKLFGARTMTFIEIENDGAGIWKSRDIENERAAYIVDRFFGFNLVPPTVIRTIEGTPGSLQQFIADAKTGYEVENEKFPLPDEDVVKMAVFDFLIDNGDRNGGNFLLKGNKIFAIDHGIAFGRYGGEIYFYRRNDMLNRMIPKEVKNNILTFVAQQNSVDLLRGFLQEILSERQVAAFFRRLELLVGCSRRGRFFSEEEWNSLVWGPLH